MTHTVTVRKPDRMGKHNIVDGRDTHFDFQQRVHTWMTFIGGQRRFVFSIEQGMDLETSSVRVDHFISMASTTVSTRKATPRYVRFDYMGDKALQR